MESHVRTKFPTLHEGHMLLERIQDTDRDRFGPARTFHTVDGVSRFMVVAASCCGGLFFSRDREAAQS